MKKQATQILKLIAALTLVTACTKSRQAELPEDSKPDVFAISEFGTVNETSTFKMNSKAQSTATGTSMKALDVSANLTLSTDDVTVPERLKFMFDNLPVSGQSADSAKIVFTIDKDYVTSYKMVATASVLTPLEKSIAISLEEAQLLGKVAKAKTAEIAALAVSQKMAAANRSSIKEGQKTGSLLVPMFKYKIDSYGVLERTKNDLKEDTAVLTLKKTDFKNATHIQISSRSDSRLLVGMNADQMKQIDQLFVESKIDNQIMSADELEQQYKVGIKFLDAKTKVFTRLDADVMHIYEITKASTLNENQLRLFKNKAGNQEVVSCQDGSVASVIQSKDKECVLVLKADVPIQYKSTSLTLVDLQGNTSNALQFQNVPRSKSVGLVEILENTPAKQVDISGTLDPDSSVRIADLKGEFFYRRTFEEASNMFLGRTGTSGDMSIVRFELEDKRLVVRNQQSLISYTGQGPKDREEVMSFPVKYIRMNKVSATGAALTIPVAEATTKEKAEYAIIDWTQNTVPNASSPLSFFDGGDCFLANSSQRVTGTDMRLSTDGVLNFSLSGSYTMKPTMQCISYKNTNSAYWGGMYQFNYNVAERISFQRRKSLDSDKQFSMNISPMAQSSFNFGVFTLADKVTGNGTLTNRDGSEKYLPMIHDFRNGRKIKYYIGGLNNPEVTTPERRQLIIDASKEVIKEWNTTLRYAFRGTSLERAGDYVDVVVDEGNNTGHLGDLDRNYIWFQELQAENGLLGVAQPAANPRSGAIESANVIVYSGNSFDQTQRQIAFTRIARDYEKRIEAVRKKVVAQAKEEQAAVASKDLKNTDPNTPKTEAGRRIEMKTNALLKELIQTTKYYQLDNANAVAALKGLKIKKSASRPVKLTKETLRRGKGRDIPYDENELTFTRKIAELTSDKSLMTNPHAFELAVNTAFLKFAGIKDEKSRAALQNRSNLLNLAVRFDENNKNRPGCFEYQRTDINDTALSLDPDEHKNLLANFKQIIKSTLSHELGHAFGLLHNFRASVDKANYEFPEDRKNPTGRNYSSIMDYMSDIDMSYRGPGPYDAYALRAAYTGMVEMPDDQKTSSVFGKVKVVGKNLVSISDIMKARNETSLVHYTKSSLNMGSTIKYYEQCDDGGLSGSALCAQFDSGGSPEEIVRTKIADYKRAYVSKNYAYDRINFGWEQKMEMINRNLYSFYNIHEFMEDAVASQFFSVGRNPEDSEKYRAELAVAAKLSYEFFHEVLRIPDAPSSQVTDFEDRFYAVPYQYEGTKEVSSDILNCKKAIHENDKSEFILCDDVNVIEAKSLFDINMSPDKSSTLGIHYDKMFAMQFLMNAYAIRSPDEDIVKVSTLDYEQLFLGVEDPSESLTIKTLIDVMTDNLTAGFFKPNEELKDAKLLEIPNLPVTINKILADQTAASAVIGLAQSKWTSFDPFGDSFKIARSFVSAAPKDRLNVAKYGQDRNISDTRVYYAMQNSSAADVLINQAAKIETLAENKQDLTKSFQAVYEADMVYQNQIMKIILEQCKGNDKNELLDPAACAAFKKKTVIEYVKEFPDVRALKNKADVVAAKLAAYVRKINENGVIMDKELDKKDSKENFAAQIEGLRQQMISQIGFLNLVFASIEKVDPKQLGTVMGVLQQQAAKIQQKNRILRSLPLAPAMFDFLISYSKNMKVKLVDGREITGDMIVAMAVGDVKPMTEQQEQMGEVLDTLSNYTGMMDPDARAPR